MSDMRPDSRSVRRVAGGGDGAAGGAVSDGVGIDAPLERRPGVPMETEPRIADGVHWESPPRQPATEEILKRPDLSELTPVFGSAQPPHGLSGVLRRYAYGIPDHKARHWAILLLADRVDVAESALVELVRERPLAAAGAALLIGSALAFGAAAIRTVNRRGRRPRLSRWWFG
jgi:hypothetical protein